MPAPVLSAASTKSVEAIEFPVVDPVVKPEPIEDTSQRLIEPSCGVMPPDPTTVGYFCGPYTGALWRKKVVEEENDKHLKAGVVEAPQQGDQVVLH